MQNNNF